MNGKAILIRHWQPHDLKRSFRFDLLMAILAALFFSLIILVLLSLIGAASWREVVTHISSAKGLSSIILSLKTSLTVVALTLALGFPVAYMLALKQFRGKALLDTLLELPIIMPPLVTGLCLLLLLNPGNPCGGLLQRWGIQLLFTPCGIVLAQFFCCRTLFHQDGTGEHRFHSGQPAGRLGDAERL